MVNEGAVSPHSAIAVSILLELPTNRIFVSLFLRSERPSHRINHVMVRLDRTIARYIVLMAKTRCVDADGPVRPDQDGGRGDVAH